MARSVGNLSLESVISRLAVKKPELTFLQIGAFDGVSGDPLYPLVRRYCMKGVLVEPQLGAFRKLQANYASFRRDDFRFVNAAIAATDGTGPLYSVRDGTPGPMWLPQIASLLPETLRSHAAFVNNLEENVVVEDVRYITINELFRELALSRLDILIVDCEGSDAPILREVDCGALGVEVIQFEHKHMSVGAYTETIRRLIDLGYYISVAVDDTVSYREEW